MIASLPVKIRERLAALDWDAIGASLDTRGWAKTPVVLTANECAALAEMWPNDARFRKRIDMASHAYGEGGYGYFKTPLPPLVREMRAAAYRPLAEVANRWAAKLGQETRFPKALAAFLKECHARGQTRPTPLLLRYETGGFNCLHRDLYGDVVFPLQLTCFLSRRGVDYDGGDFMLIEQRPRAQSRGEVIPGEQGEIVIFAVRDRPAKSKRGFYRAALRHGVATITRGERYALGIIFHDAA